ncbi:hypothetical protein VN97_g3869 [Penicillium thymicola]|uniref:Xylanolytic transcriptional activator regulatory domain-containing protein n=1 Tax=Penicillium thymicola TaxID=293382 RepID=A0AAI9TLP5_PENTH|nr:hypothetical protein VN97_g3869 [Penicillium thymicola]
MQHIYRDLVSNPSSHPEPSGGVEEAGAGLDLFSFRRIFFGTPDFHESNKSPGKGDLSMMFLPYDLARLFMSRFLSSLYHLIPLRPKIYYEKCLDRLYNSSPTDHLDAFTQAILLLAMASASLGTEHFAWGDVLFERVKALFYANYQNEQGRPNSTFLHLGSASRKALSAGLHKDVPHDVDQTPENIEERRVTFWSLYIYETWFCFHVGRPTSLSLKDAAIEYPQDQFIRLLVQLCKSITRSVNEIYGQRHESLLHMWRVAESIAKDIRCYEAHLQQALGLGLDDSTQAGSLGVRQIIFITLYNHTLLLTFRPFLIFRGHWQRECNIALNQPTTNVTNRPRATPSWLNEACNHAITAAQRIIHHLCEASKVNNLVLELRYHGYFFGNSVFTLIYEFIHNPSVAPLYLPWVYASLQALSAMRAGDPVTSTISAIQTVLRNINPSYEWVPLLATTGDNFVPPGGTPVQQGLTPDRSHQSQLNNPAIPQNPSIGMRSGILASPNLPHMEKRGTPETGGSAGSGDDLLDFTQSDMGWNFDFSTMDLDAFFSIYQSNDAPVL